MSHGCSKGAPGGFKAFHGVSGMFHGVSVGLRSVPWVFKGFWWRSIEFQGCYGGFRDVPLGYNGFPASYNRFQERFKDSLSFRGVPEVSGGPRGVSLGFRDVPECIDEIQGVSGMFQ